MYQKARRRLILPFLLPQIILYVLISFMPLVLTVVYAFTDWEGHGMRGWIKFIGLENFRAILNDYWFQIALKNSLIVLVVGGIITFVPAMAMAWSLRQPIRAKGSFRFIILAPLVIPATIVALWWRWIYNPAVGPINLTLRAIGLREFALPWMSDTKTALLAIILTSTWHTIGTWVLLLSAGLTRIPSDFPEAAKVDGASDWQIFRYITVPLMWEVLRVLLVLWVMQALQAFTFFFIMGRGIVRRSTMVMATYVYWKTLGQYKWAYGMSLATAMLIIIFFLSLFVYRSLMREIVEY